MTLALVPASQGALTTGYLQRASRVVMMRKYDYYDHNGILSREEANMGVGNWTVAEAKARFSEVIEQAQSRGPQTITKHGRTAAIVVSAEEWEKKTKRTGSLAEFFAASPLRGSGIEIERKQDHPRKTDL